MAPDRGWSRVVLLFGAESVNDSLVSFPTYVIFLIIFKCGGAVDIDHE